MILQRLLLVSLALATRLYAQELPIVVVITSYNNKEWYQRNLDSVFAQKYENYRIIYVDDASPDGTGGLVEGYIQEKEQAHRVTLIKNFKQRYALANLYTAIHTCGDREIVAVLDGDDWFAHDNVLSYLNAVYTDPNVWLTYGQFQCWPRGDLGWTFPMPDDVVRDNVFRKMVGISHLRTFYAGLFKRIKREDMMINGDFFRTAYDNATMFPMIEMAGERFKYITEVLYIYNVKNALSWDRIGKSAMTEMDLIIRLRPRYARIASLDVDPYNVEQLSPVHPSQVYSWFITH